MVHISRTTHERKAIGTIIDNNVMLWLNEKHIEKGLDQKNVPEITIKYHSNHKKHRYELVEKLKNNAIEILLTKNQQSK